MAKLSTYFLTLFFFFPLYLWSQNKVSRINVVEDNRTKEVMDSFQARAKYKLDSICIYAFTNEIVVHD